MKRSTAVDFFDVRVFQLERFSKYDVDFFLLVDGIGSQSWVWSGPLPRSIDHFP